MERSTLQVVNALFLSLLLLGSGTDAQGSSSEVCPLLGSNNQTEFLQSTRGRLFMNFGAPAQCNGTVTSWRYCSYNRYMEDNEDCDGRENYMAKFLVYRQIGNSTYEPVPGSTKSVTLSLRCPSDGGFQCGRLESLTPTEQFNIQVNDIVAACLLDQDPIRLVSNELRGSSRQVYRYSGEDCTSSQLATVDTQNSAFTLDTGIAFFVIRYYSRLHLYAETSSSPVAQCTGGSNPPPFTPSLISGTYLNTDNPISCTDTVTSWNYCYYPSAANNSQLTYTATIGVWRMNATMIQYELVPGSNYTLQLVQPPSTPARIFCKKEVLQPVNYVRVQTGDVIGVSLPTQNALPIVSSGANGYSLKTETAINAPSVLRSNTLNTASSLALHLNPTIEFIPTEVSPTTRETESTTTSAAITEESSDKTEDSDRPRTPQENDSTSESSYSSTRVVVTPGSGGGGSNRESNSRVAIAIAAFILLLLIVITAVVIGIVVYKMKHIGGQKRRKSSGKQLSKHLGVYATESSGTELTSPYYAKVENGYEAILPQHYEQQSTAAKYSTQVYYSQVGANYAHEYSILLEQVTDDKKRDYEEDPYYTPAKEESELYDQLHQQGIKMIRSKDIEITGTLGEGQFGTVRKGVWKNKGGSSTTTVAVKTLKEGSEERDKVKFLQEAAIMAQFKHHNVVTLHGVVSTGRTLMIVVELLAKGDLKQHLISMKPDPGLMLPSFVPKTLLTYCQQIALGMQYLASKGFVHRDLAARNILMSEKGICKIADFGMSRDLADDDYYVSQGGKVPVKWTAPEAIHFKKYSTASDVWSYGCLLYEIWSLGHKPHGSMRNQEVIAQIDSGLRLPPPPGCPKTIYKIMIDCWHPTTSHRPGFRGILLALLQKEETVLDIPSDLEGDNLSAVLGAPLEAGFNMYPELQSVYCADYALLD